MVRRIIIASFLIVALLPAAGLAQDEETGTVRGTVENGTEGGGDVAGLEVVLLRFEGMEQVDEYTTTVADDGTYEFIDLPLNDGEAFLATVTYEDIEFRSGMILLTQEPDAERDITVYEQTDDRSVLRIISRGVVIAGADPEVGVIDVLEIIALENDSDRVFVGDEQGHVLHLAMPDDASEISPQPGFDFGQMHFEDNVLVSTGRVIPGSHNPMISYRIPYEGTSGTLRIGTAMETGTLRVLVEEDTFNISSQVLEPAGQAQVGNDQYDVLALDRPVVGDTISVRISGLPRENWNLPIGMSTFFASIAAGVGLVIGTVLIYQVVQRRKLMPEAGGEGVDPGFDEMSADELEKERLELASELNRLEADFERGDLDEETYQSERDEILGDLRQISLRMRGIDDG
jgi:hypothetical protein